MFARRPRGRTYFLPQTWDAFGTACAPGSIIHAFLRRCDRLVAFPGGPSAGSIPNAKWPPRRPSDRPRPRDIAAAGSMQTGFFINCLKCTNRTGLSGWTWIFVYCENGIMYICIMHLCIMYHVLLGPKDIFRGARKKHINHANNLKPVCLWPRSPKFKVGGTRFRYAP